MAAHSSVLAWRIPGTGGAWWAAIYVVTQSRTRLKRLSSSSLEKEMATHSSILAWEIPWTEEPGRLQSMRSRRVGHDRVTNTHIHSLTHTLTCTHIFHFRFFLQNSKCSSLCCTVDFCWLFYIYWWVYVNPNILINPFPYPTFPCGHHKFVFCVHESFCCVNKFILDCTYKQYGIILVFV